MNPDEELARMIEDALLQDSRVSAQKIRVAVVDGVVTLHGTVQSYRRKLAAQEIASLFHDCRGVENQLVVVPAEMAADKTIATHVRAALDGHADITKATITVSVHDGEVTLGGTAETAWERVLAEDVAIGVRGVRAVRNLIVVDPDEQEEDEALSRAIAAVLAETRGLKDAAVRVAVSRGHVVLSGAVPGLWQKEVATLVVSRFQPQRITNHIVVGSKAS